MEERLRRRLIVSGRVQGVGFRPFVFRLAKDLNLGGIVGNDSRGVFVEIEGLEVDVNTFIDRLPAELPVLAKIHDLEVIEMEPLGERTFAIKESESGGQQNVEITPDVSTCLDCLAELKDETDRRYGYPFINCTNCGPRYSIVKSIPYDRRTTTMASFPMCRACQEEYDSPLDRRFHAQPNACFDCGPHVWLADREGKELVREEAISACAKELMAGKIIAIKGLGGFHLACRADDDEVVLRLRQLKARETKPLALMVSSLERARQLVDVDELAEKTLLSVAHPIVLCPKIKDCSLSDHVAPGTGTLGIMLPYTPLHELLFSIIDVPLVMTSANPSDEPLCSDNDEARERLHKIADSFLLHNRDIERAIDDSVVIAMKGHMVPLRRARGYVPAKIPVKDRGDTPILATGGDLKSTVCLLSGGEATVSEHLGELENPKALRNFVSAIERFEKLLSLKPQVVAYDMHPSYGSTAHGRRLSLRETAVQHHHAHIVSCMADNGLMGKVIGVACDGTGYGTDGAIWGCEIMECDEAGFKRMGHLCYFPLPGGDSAARQLWRPALSLLRETYGDGWRNNVPQSISELFDKEEALSLTEQRLQRDGSKIPVTSSLGRLFDGVAFLLGICKFNHHEAQAAMLLEDMALSIEEAEPLSYVTHEAEDGFLLDWRPMVKEVVEAVSKGQDRATVARAFHEALVAMLVESALRASEETDLDRVVLTGGCFANRILTERTARLLQAWGRDVFVHREVPTGDGGLSLGQAVCAAERVARGLI